MRKTGLTDEMLCQAVSEMMKGLVDGDLGGNLLKKRIGLSGRGKRGGGRTIVATNRCDRWFFLYGFEKNERANISKDEIKALRELVSIHKWPFSAIPRWARDKSASNCGVPCATYYRTSPRPAVGGIFPGNSPGS